MKISFIIPAYNVSQHIGKCLDSILGQSYLDLEIIIVNDGSTDSTHEIIESYIKKDSRIRLITQENSGQGAARNAGLTYATGEYVWFVDGDDWLIQSSLLRITKILKQYLPDVLVTNFEFSYDDQVAKPSTLVPSELVGKTIKPTSDVNLFAAVSCWNTPPWRLVSNRQHLIRADINFANGLFYEDHPFAIKLMLTAEKVYVDGSISYSYYQRSSSTTKVNDRKAFDFLEIRRQCLALFKGFNQYENLAPVVVGYVAPINFYNAHVSEAYRKDFITKLSESFGPDDFSFIDKYGDWSTKVFSRAIQKKDPLLIKKYNKLAWMKRRLSKVGLRQTVKRLESILKARILSFILLVKNIAVNQNRHSEVDFSGTRFMQVGSGTRLESVYIDVRVNQQPRAYVSIGENSLVGGVYVFERGLGSVIIGNKTSIGSGSKFICTQEDGIQIGNNVMISWDCTFIDSDAHSLDPELRMNDAYEWKCGLDANKIGVYKDWSQVKSSPIIIEDNVWIGFDVVVMKGVRVGKGSVVGARSLVTSDIPPYCVYAGNPARFIRYVPRESWSWDDIINAAQGDPQMRKLLEESYLIKDIGGSLNRFRSSEEFKETLKLIRNARPNAKKILDVGGANGVMSVAFALEGYEVTLVEPSSSDIGGVNGAIRLLNYAIEHYDSSLIHRVNILNGFIEDIENITEDYDVAYCRQVVHHFTDPLLALAKIRGYLLPDAILLLIREHVIFDEIDKKAFLDSHPFHKYTGGENAYKLDEYYSFIESAGFNKQRILTFCESPINSYPHNHELINDMLEKNIPGRPYSFIAHNKN